MENAAAASLNPSVATTVVGASAAIAPATTLSKSAKKRIKKLEEAKEVADSERLERERADGMMATLREQRERADQLAREDAAFAKAAAGT